MKDGELRMRKGDERYSRGGQATLYRQRKKKAHDPSARGTMQGRVNGARKALWAPPVSAVAPDLGGRRGR